PRNDRVSSHVLASGLRLLLFACGRVLARRTDEAGEQRMAIARRGSELRMELAADEPGMPGNLGDLDEIVHRFSGKAQSLAFQCFAVIVVELVAVAMTLDDHVRAVELARQRARLQEAFLRAQPHGAAKVGLLA